MPQRTSALILRRDEARQELAESETALLGLRRRERIVITLLCWPAVFTTPYGMFVPLVLLALNPLYAFGLVAFCFAWFAIVLRKGPRDVPGEYELTQKIAVLQRASAVLDDDIRQASVSGYR